MKTTCESPEPTRSDCHAWGAHPVYHAYATLLGIRPAAFGFREVVVRPMPGPLAAIEAVLPHPQGEIAVELAQSGPGVWLGMLSLPAGVSGKLVLDGQTLRLHPGRQAIQFQSRVTLDIVALESADSIPAMHASRSELRARRS